MREPASRRPADALPPLAELPATSELPDPLVQLDGRRCTSPEHWLTIRRLELLRSFGHYMYGYAPVPPALRSKENIMIDHTGISVSDPGESRRFYARALAPLGYSVLMELPKEHTGGSVVVGLGVPPHPDFWLAEGKPNEPPMHVAFRAESRKQVDEFHREAIAAGGRDNGPPGLRPHYHEHYYGAFVLDPDGHNVEAVCHNPA